MESVIAMSVYLCSFVLSAAVAVGNLGVDEGDEYAPVAAQELKITDLRFYQRIFGNESGSVADAIEVRNEHDMRLRQKIAIVDRVCGLTGPQKEKLELAGRGDIKRLFDRVEKVARHFELVKDDRQEAERLYEENARRSGFA